jgi:hypothetical protein
MRPEVIARGVPAEGMQLSQDVAGSKQVALQLWAQAKNFVDDGIGEKTGFKL